MPALLILSHVRFEFERVPLPLYESHGDPATFDFRFLGKPGERRSPADGIGECYGIEWASTGMDGFACCALD